MTREEAIEILKQYREKPTLINEIESVDEAVWLDEALEMAIKALEQEPCDDCISRKDTCTAIIKRLGIKNVQELIDAINQQWEERLDKIRAEFISRYPKNYMGEPELGGASCVFSLCKVLEIIDKYKKESEVSE